MGTGFLYQRDPTRVSSNPGYAFGRSGNVPMNSWLNSEGIPTNKVGIPFGLADGTLEGVWAGGEDVDTYDIEVWEHEGDEINLTLIDTVSVVAARTATFTFVTPSSITKDRQLAVKLINGSAKNLKVYLDVKGVKI